MNTENIENAAMKKRRRRQNVNIGNEGRDQYRVVITGEANIQLEDLVNRVNQGFESGNVTKSDVANFVFSTLLRHVSDSDIRNLRALHFDDKKVLGTLLKNEDDLPEDVKRAIRAHYGIADRKRPGKGSAITSNEVEQPVFKD